MPYGVLYAIGVIAFVVALLTSVMLHELGHFATAKRFGMKASRFFVGFGPTLWSVRRGETEYGVKAIPAGGFVKIEGMTALDEIAPEDADRAFYKQPAGKRTIVLCAGSFMHFVIAIVLVFGVLAVTHQDPIRTSGISVAAVTKCVTASPDDTCRTGDVRSPALGVLRAGDRLVAVNGVAASASGNNVLDILRKSAGKQVAVTVVRDGIRKTVSLTPAPLKVHGKIDGRLGISVDNVAQHVGLAAAVPRTFSLLGDFVSSTGSAIGGLPHEVAGILEGKPRDQNGAASVVDVARVSGQVSASSGSVTDRIASLALILAELNLFVGIFNLLPLLPLDGGHVAILAFEEARTRVYRLVGRRDPGRVDILKVLPLTYAVVAVFVALSAILLYAGITNPITLQ